MTISSIVVDGLGFSPSLMIRDGYDIAPPSNPSTGTIPVSPSYAAEHSSPNRTPIYQVRIRPSGVHPVGYWKLEETGTATRLDTQGRNDMVPSGSIGTGTGIVGNGAQLVRASSQYFSATVTDDSLQVGGDIQFMIIATVVLDSKPGSMSIVSQYGVSTGGLQTSRSFQLRYESSADRFGFAIRDFGGTEVEVLANVLGPPSIGTYYTIVAWRTKTNINIQVNGLLNTTATSIIPALVSEPLRIGANASGGVAGDFWNGIVDEVILFTNSILTTTQATSYYNSGAVMSYEDFVDSLPSYQFSTSWPVTNEDIGDELLVPIELTKRIDVEKWRFPLTTLIFDLVDHGSVITAMIAAGINGFSCTLYAGFYDLTWAATPVNYALLFTGIIGENQYQSGRYRIWARSPMTAAADRVIFAGANTRLTAACSATDTTFTVEDASAFEPASNLPQTARKLCMIDSDITVYRNKTNTQLQNLLRSTTYGYPVPPAAEPAVPHLVGAAVKELIKTGDLLTTNSGAADDSLHPIELIKDILTKTGKYGLGESHIPINTTELDAAKVELGLDLQYLSVLSEGQSAKAYMEQIYRDLAATPTENEAGQIGIKLHKPASQLSFVGTITDANITEFPRWVRNAENGWNRVYWHYDHMPTLPAGKDYLATYEYRDDTLIAAMGHERTLEIFSKGIRRHWVNQNPAAPTLNWFGATAAFLPARAAAHVNRFGGLYGAHVISCVCLLDRNLLQPSNDVKVSFSQVINMATATRSVTDQAAEIVSMRHRFQEAVVELELLLYPTV